jgi:ferrous iron transport protein A
MISLNELPDGRKGIIMEIKGGHGLVKKLDALGIRAGKEITKVNSQWMKGPVIIRSGNTEIAIEYGMTNKIMVEIK